MGKFSNNAAFIGVIEHGSFAEAARKMGLSRSHVNKSVIALEDALGVQLLVRTTRKVSPTPSGEAYYKHVRRIMTDLEDAERAVSEDNDEPRGILRLNAPMSFGSLHLASAITDFMCQYPKLSVELSLDDRFIDPIAEGYDATIRIAELNNSPSLIDHPIVKVRRYFMASPQFLRENGQIEAPEQLKSLRCLHYGTLGEGHMWRIVGNDKTHTIQVNGVMCANNGEVLYEAAKRGLGIAFLPTFIAGPALQSGELVRVLTEYTPPEIHLMLLYPPNRHLAPKIKRLIDFLYDRFGGRPYWDLFE